MGGMGPPPVVTALVVGDRNSGRSCLVNRMQRETFPGAMRDAPSDQGSEAALSGWSRQVALPDDVSISVAIYDTPLNCQRVTPPEGDSFSARRRTSSFNPRADTLAGKQPIRRDSSRRLSIPQIATTVVESHRTPMQIPSDEHFVLMDVVIFAVSCETLPGAGDGVVAESFPTAVHRLSVWFEALKRHGGAWIVVGTKWDLCSRNGEQPTDADRESFVESLVVPAAQLAKVAVGERPSDPALPFIGGVFLTSAAENWLVGEVLEGTARIGKAAAILRPPRRSSAANRRWVTDLDKSIDQAAVRGFADPLTPKRSTVNWATISAAVALLLLAVVGALYFF